MREVQIKLEGLPGEALRIMRDERGWRWMATPFETESRLENSTVKMNITFKTWLTKYGKVESQENWNAELLEVWKGLNDEQSTTKRKFLGIFD